MKESYVNAEATRSMKEWGWVARSVRDALRCHNCGTLIYPSKRSGCYDINVYVPIWLERRHEHIMVEVKHGETSFPFNEFRESQREFTQEWFDGELEDIDELWLWLSIGKAITDKDYPRKTLLVPIYDWLKLERRIIRERKSFPYDYDMGAYELEWEGHGYWSVPPIHVMRTVYGYLE